MFNKKKEIEDCVKCEHYQNQIKEIQMQDKEKCEHKIDEYSPFYKQHLKIETYYPHKGLNYYFVLDVTGPCTKCSLTYTTTKYIDTALISYFDPKYKKMGEEAIIARKEKNREN